MLKSYRRMAPMLGGMLLAVAATVSAAQELSPEETVKRYLAAVQSQQFDKAYDLVSKAMKTDRKSGQVKSKELWTRESQYIFGFSEAKIFDFRVGQAKVEGDKATVPNVLSSQDKFLNQLGVEEYELYVLVKEDGAWKVDRQEEVIEPEDIAKWFPKEQPKP